MEANACVDEAEMCKGMPTTVQVMGKSMMDEELVQVMKVVEGVLGEEQ
jgi:amidase